MTSGGKVSQPGDCVLAPRTDSELVRMTMRPARVVGCTIVQILHVNMPPPYVRERAWARS